MDPKAARRQMDRYTDTQTQTHRHRERGGKGREGERKVWVRERERRREGERERERRDRDKNRHKYRPTVSQSDRQTDRLGLACASETSKPIPNDILLPMKPHLPILSSSATPW